MSRTLHASDSPVRILIAEDSPTQSQRLRYILEMQGYAVRAAADGLEALELAAQFRPAMIISDVVMPRVDGYELARRIKADPATRDIPIILVTTMSDPQDVISGLQCGADNFVIKPYEERYLLDRVRYVLVNREIRGAEDTGMGVEVYFNARRHFITADRLQILNLLLSTYDAAIQRNKELNAGQEELRRSNLKLNELAAELESRVAERTVELERSNEALRESEARNRLIVDTALDAAITMDDEGLIREWNPQAEVVFGWTREEALGRRVADLVVPSRHRDGHERGLKRFLATGEGPLLGRRVEITGIRRGEVEFPVELSITPIRVKGAWMFSCFARDITERKRAEDEVRRANEELEQRVRERTAELEAANRAKGTFLATMSHEIRTPMNGVLGMLELLGLTELDQDQRATLGIVRESGKSLLRIIDDILDFSKIEAGKLEVIPEATSVTEVVERVVRIYSGNAASKGLALRHAVDPRIRPALWIDPVRVQQILNNFMSNAIKFTPRGHVEIAAELVERRGDEDLLRFSVRDTGVGISAENQKLLFQPFAQVEGKAGSRVGSSGLGLSICRRLADMMRGSVEMTSEPGVGTTMVLTLPAVAADSAALPKASATSVPEAARGFPGLRRTAPPVARAEKDGSLILVVDDHPINCLVLTRQVNILGYAAETADNGLSALDKIESGRFALVLTDCSMPEMDGYELARRLRGREAAKGLKRIPIIACTANAMSGEAEACLAAGMDDYLAKPVELKDLLGKLERWLPLPRGAEDGKDAPGAPRSS